jgi:hypothetical protein
VKFLSWNYKYDSTHSFHTGYSHNLMNPVLHSKILQLGVYWRKIMTIRTYLFLILMSSLAGTGFAQDALSISPSGDVGIGTTTPSEKLDVDGNIKASGKIMYATGFLMPVGSIMPYGGTTAPDGWLMCDGTAVSRTTYAELFTVVGTAFGEGDGTTTFNLPDLRGTFLRGRDAGAGRDPDAGGCEEMASGGNSGDAVGSVQDDQYKSHTHTITRYWNNVFHGNGGQFAGHYNGSAYSNGQSGGIEESGGNETRPVNAYVNFILKY